MVIGRAAKRRGVDPSGDHCSTHSGDIINSDPVYGGVRTGCYSAASGLTPNRTGRDMQPSWSSTLVTGRPPMPMSALMTQVCCMASGQRRRRDHGHYVPCIPAWGWRLDPDG